MNSPSRTTPWPRILLLTCRRIEQGESLPQLQELARAAGVSASELQRQFRRRLGVSPKAYGQALRLNRLVSDLGRHPTALDATLDAGFESTSVAYTHSARSLGATPGNLRGVIDMGWWLGLSDLGWMLMAATPKGICWLAFGDEPQDMLEALRAAYPRAQFHNDQPRLHAWFEAVREYILLPREALDLPVDIQGTAFQSRVWTALRDIPLGASTSYGALAQRIGKPGAARAVGAAVGRNKVALLVPCHRVVAADGRLSGYRWGPERKAELLRREAGEPAESA